MTALIVGCIVGVVVFCIVYPPAAWAVGMTIGVVVAFGGNTRG